MRRTCFLVLALLLLLNSAPIPTVQAQGGTHQLPSSDLPRLTASEVALQIGCGTALGTTLGAVGVLIGIATVPDGADFGQAIAGAVRAVLLAYLGYCVGAPAGVYLVGSRGEVTGSVFATTLGALAGGAAALQLGNTLYDTEREQATGLAPAVFVGLLTLGPIGAAVGFNLTRRLKDPPAAASLEGISTSGLVADLRLEM